MLLVVNSGNLVGKCTLFQIRLFQKASEAIFATVNDPTSPHRKVKDVKI